MPSFLSRLQSLVTGVPPEPDATAGAGADAVARPGTAPAGTAAPTPPAELLRLLTGAPVVGAPEPRTDGAAVGAPDPEVPRWAVRAAAGTTALELHGALRARAGAAAGAGTGWWPVVALDDDVERGLTHEPEPAAELAGTDVEDGPAWLDARWEAATGRSERELRLQPGLHSGTTPADVVAAVTAALVGPPPAREDDAVVLVPATAAWQVPAVLGWAPVDGGLSPHDLSAVLQYWEEQWGAELVALGSDAAVLRVDDPPASPEDATAVAQELLAVAPLLVVEDLVEPLPRAAELLAPALLGAGWWYLDLG